MMTEKQTKTQLIIKYMKTHNGISNIEAFKYCRQATRLSGIIWNLRSAGFDIESHEHQTKDGIRFVRYHLISEPE